ncbi:MAG: YraN family protein [Bradymonadia bacterium]
MALKFTRGTAPKPIELPCNSSATARSIGKPSNGSRSADSGRGPRSDPQRQAVARAGEELACSHLSLHGWSIVDRNWRCPQGELDIVATRGDVLAFVEVKTRRNPGGVHPAHSVTRAKQRRLARAADAYLQSRRPIAAHWRFDIISIWQVEGTWQVSHIEGAFTPSGAF